LNHSTSDHPASTRSVPCSDSKPASTIRYSGFPPVAVHDSLTSWATVRESDAYRSATRSAVSAYGVVAAGKHDAVDGIPNTAPVRQPRERLAVGRGQRFRGLRRGAEPEARDCDNACGKRVAQPCGETLDDLWRRFHGLVSSDDLAIGQRDIDE
jgi:hypothetical protein